MKWQYVVALLLIGAAVALVAVNEHVHSKNVFDITQMEDYNEVMRGL